MTNDIRRMGIVSDLHCLFRYGLVPPGYWPQDSATDYCYKFYTYLWDCWNHFIDECPPLDVLVVNGDWLHGEDRIDRAINVISSDMMDQAIAGVQTLTPLRKKAKRLWVLKGTPYHEGRAHEALEWAARECDAQRWAPNRHVGYSGYFEFAELTLCFAHHQTAGWLYTAGGASRTAMLHRAAEAENKVPHADVLVRSHLHQKAIVKAHGIWSVQTPGWTVVYPWLEKVSEHSRARMKNDIGALVLETDGSGAVHFREWSYPHAKEEVRQA